MNALVHELSGAVRKSDVGQRLTDSIPGQKWDALAIDLHAWSFQGLLSLQKIRSEYQAMPLIALVYPAVKDLEKRAMEAGASRCLTLDSLTARELHAAIASVMMEKKAEPQHQKEQEKM